MSDVLARCVDLAIFATCAAWCCTLCQPRTVYVQQAVSSTNTSVEGGVENATSVPNVSLLKIER